MLLKDKYTPLFLKNFVINKNTATKYLNFYSKYFILDSIIYGPNGCGKYTFFKAILNTIYNKEIKVKYKNFKLGNKEKVIPCSDYHFEILIDKYNNNNLIEIIDLLTESKDINNKCFIKIILLRNIHFCNQDFLNYLKVKVESSRDNYRFFLISTNNISVINNKCKGIFHKIPLKYDSKENIINFYKNNIENFNEKKFLKCFNKQSTLNLNELLTNYELYLEQSGKFFVQASISNIIKHIKGAPQHFQIILKKLETKYIF